MRPGTKIAIAMAVIGLTMIIFATAIAPKTCSDLGCAEVSYGPTNGELLGLVGVFLLGFSAIVALNAWKPRVKTS